jgi:hypothetical protein
MTCDRGTDFIAQDLQGYGPRFRPKLIQNLDQETLYILGRNIGGGRFDGHRALAKGLDVKSIGGQFLGDFVQSCLLLRLEFDNNRQQEPLTFHFPFAAQALVPFEENAFVGYMLVNDPEATSVGRDNETVFDLPKGLQVCWKLGGASLFQSWHDARRKLRPSGITKSRPVFSKR